MFAFYYHKKVQLMIVFSAVYFQLHPKSLLPGLTVPLLPIIAKIGQNFISLVFKKERRGFFVLQYRVKACAQKYR